MKENQISRTAMCVAYCREYHAMHDTPKIFDDFLAGHLISEEVRPVIEQTMISLHQAMNPAASFSDQATDLEAAMKTSIVPPTTLSRSRYTEDSLEEAVRQGVQQYVILGAGLDTFAFRRKNMLDKLRVFEVDHPATQAYKRHRLTQLNWKLPANLHFVPVDFTMESLAEALTHSTYDPQVSSYFSWLGVSNYLTRDEVLATLHNIADIAPSGSTVIFDYLDTDIFVPEKVAKRMQAIMGLAQQVGESFKTGFDPTTLAAELAGQGLRLQENLNPSDIKERYFRGCTNGYYPNEHLHIARAVVE